MTTALSKSSMFAQEKLTSLFPKIFSFKFYRMLKSKIDLFQFYLPKDWLIRDVRSFQKNKANFYSHIFIVQGRAKILWKWSAVGTCCSRNGHWSNNFGIPLLPSSICPFIFHFTAYLIRTILVFFINSNEWLIQFMQSNTINLVIVFINHYG